MAMLKKRMLLKALIDELPRIIHLGRQNGKPNRTKEVLIEELTKVYGQLGLYDHIMDKIRLGGIL